ncbi:ER-golgi trafficking TRAPP I complex 85 kDa subunit-domain-containing protein [Kockovaella imperatae]|uniref:ER-golgi trafficking TRAPP I complex 85 kDa subunit-domain-containing protein n=1 Tax=Kockovaella imperatae TaxID=4999 RepID=A0A1Y1U6L6_9TREE|nr:ER-golgi trafficking TRAPP I complex 85 kDa subunit-domain-containing protein [Kockovaella imperatae]ORX33680.1 ER-golgi trafficking TRAPP I complex 85 kDa subunit-domain-containing protein [Kockovaella imperatae]
MPSPPLPLVQSLSPRIAVLTSDDVVDSCEANGCCGLEELLRPWESSAEMGKSIMSSTLTPTKHPTFPLRFVSYSSIFPHPESSNPNPDIVVDMTSSLVGSKRPEDELHYPITRSMLLSSRPIAGHETFNHPVGVLLAISTLTPEPLGALQRLQARAMGPMSQVIPWMDGVNVLRFFVVVHDVSRKGENLEEAYDLLAAVKKNCGPHSTLLVINSQITPRQENPLPAIPHPAIPLPKLPVESISWTYSQALASLSLTPALSPQAEPDSKVYGVRLSPEDLTRLVALVKELVTQSVVPWMEARIREWNELWHANRRGITGRLFGAGRKFFTSRPNSPAPNAQGYNSVKGFYPVTSIEAVSRRLADFAFMLRDYKFASTVYDSLRRDFAQDRAWRYAAAATEMYGLSLLLSHNYFQPSTPPTLPNAPFTTLQHTDISSWLEQAVIAYQGRAPPTQIQLDALRITVLYYEAWKMIGEWRGVASALVRAAGEADEVPSAVMIEEAAAVDVRKGRQGKRRRAFHLVLAARRYETTGLKTFSRRCLDRASDIYRSAPWTAAQDLIEYTLGRQAYTLGESDVAVQHFLRLIGPREGPSHGGILEDLKLAHEVGPSVNTDEKPRNDLPVTIFDIQATRITTPYPPISLPPQLEKPLAGRKLKQPDGLSQGEMITVELVARNPLPVELRLTNLHLTAEPTIEIASLDSMILQPNESRLVSFPVNPTDTGSYTISTISFLFHGFYPCTQSLKKQGKRLHASKEQRLTPTYAQDRSLTFAVGPPRPRVVVQLLGMPTQMFQGEVVDGSISILNPGSIEIQGVDMITSETGVLIGLHDEKVTATNRIMSNTPFRLTSDIIAPGQTISIPLIFTALSHGDSHVQGVILYDNESTSFAAQVEVLPLLDARVWVEPRKMGRLALDLQLGNLSDSPVSIESLEGSGIYWSVYAQKIRDDLLPGQTLSCLLSVKDASGSDLRQKELVTALDAIISGKSSSELNPNFPSGISMSPSFLASLHRHRISFLLSHFPTIPASSLTHIFPLHDPLDLNIHVGWSLGSRRGTTYLHGLRVGPEFSIVEDLRRQVSDALAAGGKATRVMYEETGRLRQQLITSILDGVYSQEDDPVCLRVKIEGSKRGIVSRGGSGAIGVVFQIDNRSPAISVRWLLTLPLSSTEVAGMDPARFTSTLTHRGTLEPGQAKEVFATIWVDRPSLVSLDGWDLAVETGEERNGWQVRRHWHRRGESQWVEVVD